MARSKVLFVVVEVGLMLELGGSSDVNCPALQSVQGGQCRGLDRSLPSLCWDTYYDGKLTTFSSVLMAPLSSFRF